MMSAVSKALGHGSMNCPTLGWSMILHMVAPSGEFSKAWTVPTEILIQLFSEALD